MRSQGGRTAEIGYRRLVARGPGDDPTAWRAGLDRYIAAATANLVALCADHHRLVHAEPEWSYEVGLLVRAGSWPGSPHDGRVARWP
jgi:hypothetical protein